MTNKELAKIHAKNRAKLNSALTHHKQQMNLSIKSENDLIANVNIRMYLILYVAWLENSLQYIINVYHKQINSYLRNDILSQRSQIDMWEFLIKAKFREHYLKNKQKEFNILNLGHSNYNRYDYLINTILPRVSSFIIIRNKLAHGQWAVALNNEGTDKVQETTAKIWTLNKKDTLLAKNILEKFVKIIDSLVASKNAFENSFDQNVYKIEHSLYQFDTKYEWIISDMKRKYNAVSRDIVKK